MSYTKTEKQNPDAENALVAEGLIKNYGSLLALDNISFNVASGEVFGYLGPNGAGKTTTTNIFTGITQATSGIAKVFGYDITKEPVKVKKLIGIVPQEPFVFNEMSAWDNIIFKGKMHSLDKKERRVKGRSLLKEFNLYERRNDNVRTYSGGMRKLLAMTIALVHEPNLLFLDEPTTGLDVQSSRQIRNKIIKLNKRGVTIFLTTHNMEEASQLCDRVAILDEGQVITIGTPERLRQALQKELLIELELNVPSDSYGVVNEEITKFRKIETIKSEGNSLYVLVNDQLVLPALFQFIQRNKITISSIDTKKPTLEEAFVKIIDQINTTN